MFCRHCASKRRILATSRDFTMRSTLRNKRKTREENWISGRLGAEPIFTTNSPRSASKLYTKQAQWLKFLLVPFNWKSGNRSSNDPRLEFRVPDCHELSRRFLSRGTNCIQSGKEKAARSTAMSSYNFSFTETRTSKHNLLRKLNHYFVFF